MISWRNVIAALLFCACACAVSAAVQLKVDDTLNVPAVHPEIVAAFPSETVIEQESERITRQRLVSFVIIGSDGTILEVRKPEKTASVSGPTHWQMPRGMD